MSNVTVKSKSSSPSTRAFTIRTFETSALKINSTFTLSSWKTVIGLFGISYRKEKKRRNIIIKKYCSINRKQLTNWSNCGVRFSYGSSRVFFFGGGGGHLSTSSASHHSNGTTDSPLTSRLLWQNCKTTCGGGGGGVSIPNMHTQRLQPRAWIVHCRLTIQEDEFFNQCYSANLSPSFCYFDLFIAHLRSNLPFQCSWVVNDVQAFCAMVLYQ